MGPWEEDWTLVQRGRRRQRARNPVWDRSWDRSTRWMERAPPVSRQGRATFPQPRQGRATFPHPNPKDSGVHA